MGVFILMHLVASAVLIYLSNMIFYVHPTRRYVLVKLHKKYVMHFQIKLSFNTTFFTIYNIIHVKRECVWLCYKFVV